VFVLVIVIDSPLELVKSLKVSERTHDKILRCGKMGQSMDDVVEMLCDYYMEKELKSKK
jgi:hypothetical protein